MATKGDTPNTVIGSGRPSLTDLYNLVVNNVADKWRDLGVQLLRPDQEKLLDIIAANHPHDVVSCCKCVLKKWLDTTTDATWNELIRTLRSPSVQLDCLAGQLEETELTTAEYQLTDQHDGITSRRRPLTDQCFGPQQYYGQRDQLTDIQHDQTASRRRRQTDQCFGPQQYYDQLDQLTDQHDGITSRRRRQTDQFFGPQQYYDQRGLAGVVEMPQQINQSYLKARHIPLTDFTAYESDVMKKGKLKEQYEYLWQVGVYQPTDASMMDRTWYKNRYSNVLPYDHSRVKLATLPGEPGSDYINASYIPGYKLKQEYIAAQGPLSCTIGDFWRMVWEQDVQSVVMVAKLTVVDRTGKSIKYWKEEPLQCCGISITLQSEKIDKHWTVREFLLVKDKTEHTVKHYQFTAEWPVYDIPDDTGPLLDLVKYFRSQQDACDSNHGPVVVHCDGGVGRTGTFIALDILLQHIEDHDWVDVFGLACEMRRYRQRMIETELQYIFIHKALTDVINSRK